MRFPQIQGKQESPHLGLKPVFKPPAGSMEHSSFHDHKHKPLGFTGSGRRAHLDYVNVWIKWGGKRTRGQIIWLIQIHWMIISKLCTGIYTWCSLYRDSTEEVKHDPSRMHKRLEMWRDWCPTREVLLPTYLPDFDIPVVALRKNLVLSVNQEKRLIVGLQIHLTQEIGGMSQRGNKMTLM